MSNQIEIIMNLDTLEIFEVIDHSQDDLEDIEVVENIITHTEEVKISPYDDLGRVWLGNGYYYKPSSLLWRNEREDVIHELHPKNKHGSYPYYQCCRNHTWGHVSQLTYEEALWLTLEFYPELMNYI
ncbi:hypothetical protein ACS60R_09155 [Streptococcus suis]|nr:hypothetical protein [Streptococcus suis]HEL2460721.1 hypothetical protein [Streptococcus suis]HEM2772126.1 hypothetical protein [Streptococcus suis]